MTAFTKREPTKVHHLDRDPEFLIELSERIEIDRCLLAAKGLRRCAGEPVVQPGRTPVGKPLRWWKAMITNRFERVDA